MKTSVGWGTGNITFFLLKYHNYIQIVKDTISDVKQTYAANDSDDNLDNQQSEFRINDRLF